MKYVLGIWQMLSDMIDLMGYISLYYISNLHLQLFQGKIPLFTH